MENKQANNTAFLTITSKKVSDSETKSLKLQEEKNLKRNLKKSSTGTLIDKISTRSIIKARDAQEEEEVKVGDTLIENAATNKKAS